VSEIHTLGGWPSVFPGEMLLGKANAKGHSKAQEEAKPKKKD
jgi:hypothetical protein